MSGSRNQEWSGPGVGMPQSLLLQQFGEHVERAFGHTPFLVGSALAGKRWRDVDVRLILPDDEYALQGYGNPERPQENKKWVSTVLAWSSFGWSITRLPKHNRKISQIVTARIHEQSKTSAESTEISSPISSKSIGERLDEARLCADISHEEQAYRIGLSRSVYFRVKAGRGGRKSRRKAESYLGNVELK